MESKEVQIVEKQTNSFELTKNTKGYSWSIKVYNDDLEVAKAEVERVDAYARAKWGNNDAARE